MPVLLAVLGFVSTICLALIYSGQIETLVAAFHRKRAKPKPGLLAAFEDARDVAVILMLMVARRRGDLTDAQVAAIRRHMRGTLGLDGREGDERLAAARVAAAAAGSFTMALTDALPQLRRKLGQNELAELALMLDDVARIDGEPLAEQHADLDAFRSKAGLAVG